MEIEWQEVVKLAIEAGFDPETPEGLSGKSELDAQIYVDEYPVGESIFKLLQSLKIEIKQ